MNREQLVTVTVALACFAALGTSATTLAATLSSDPDEAVDPDYDRLPIEREDAADLQRQIRANAESGEQSRSASAADGSTSEPESNEQGNGESGQASGSAAGQAPDSASPTTPSDASEGGLALTDEARSLLALLFPLAVVATAVAVASRYRDRILGLFAPPGDEPGETVYEAFAAPPRDANDVFAAWDALVRRLDLDPETRTTGECARAAREAGMDPEAVATLRQTFEEVRYGGLPVTEERSRHVRAARDSLGLDGSGRQNEEGSA